MILAISSITGLTYQNILKPLLFQLDAEFVHESMTTIGETLGKNPLALSALQTLYAYNTPQLSQTYHGLTFPNPIGLAAGFDYDARLTEILGALGFGFHTHGTVTYGTYEGNAKPRLGRLPQSKSLMVNKGFKSQGAEYIAEKLKGLKTTKTPILPAINYMLPATPLGISIGATNRQYDSLREQIEEHIKAFEVFENHTVKIALCDYYELNISCPNLKINPFYESVTVKQLLIEIDKLKLSQPLFIKMFIDKSLEDAGTVIKEIDKHSVQGIIIGNLTKDRNNPDLIQSEVAKFDRGNFSGKPTWDRSNALIEYTRKTFKDRFTIIGCGGVFSAEDAYLKLKLGANLIQLITGMIYQGPQIIGQINFGLSKLLKQSPISHTKFAV